MARRLSPAKTVAKRRPDGECWLDHAFIAEDDASWLRDVERLTLWNVTVPEGLLASLPRLWWLDIRGGTATDLSTVKGCQGLRYLQVNQVRKMRDLALLTQLDSLEFLSLYGLANVTICPSLRELERLLRIELGQLRNLTSLGDMLDAPNLEELYIQKRVNIAEDDVAKLNGHSSLKMFEWWAVDTPISMTRPVVESIHLPPAKAVNPLHWFKSRDL